MHPVDGYSLGLCVHDSKLGLLEPRRTRRFRAWNTEQGLEYVFILLSWSPAYMSIEIVGGRYDKV
jgi:hypothetical protein